MIRAIVLALVFACGKSDKPKPAALPATPAAQTPAQSGDSNLDTVNEAAAAYDRGEFEETLVIGKRALDKSPDNTRLLRLMVSASCILGHTEDARSYAAKLAGPDLAQMQKRCDRYGITL